MNSYKEKRLGKVQADGAFSIDVVVTGFRPVEITKHQVTVEPDGATVGTVAIEWLPWGSSTYEELKDSAGSPVVISLAGAASYTFTANAAAIKCTPTGADGTYNILCSGWNS